MVCSVTRKNQSDLGLKREVNFGHKHRFLDIIQKGLHPAAGCKLQAVVVLGLVPTVYVLTEMVSTSRKLLRSGTGHSQFSWPSFSYQGGIARVMGAV